MFTDPLAITVGGTLGATTGGTALSLAKINQDNYGSEYLVAAADGLSEYRVKIRHTKETVKASANPVDRHNVEITQLVYPTALLPLGRTRVIYLVARWEPGDVIADVLAFCKVLPAWATSANLTKLAAWES